jgi:tRNA pseudouridine55 synthase
MPLYEYARKGIPLPRPIEKRKVTVHSIEVVEWKGDRHSFRWPEKHLSEEEKTAAEKALQGAEENLSLQDKPETPSLEEAPSAFVLKMKVSGGTYVRSIVHDLGHAVGSAGHVVTLTRTRQSRFALNAEEEQDRTSISWDIFAKALLDPGPVDEEGWTEWEREVMDKMEIIDMKNA